MTRRDPISDRPSGPAAEQRRQVEVGRAARVDPGRGQLAFNGRHHEIYLSDPRKTELAKLRTILRQPVARL